MRILFAQLCKLYTFFLVAIATIVVGAPLENVITTKRTTIPVCPQNTKYNSSVCFFVGSLMIFCENPHDPNDLITITQDCGIGETCIEHYHAYDDDLATPHATCIDNETRVRKWDNFANPSADACSVERSYSTSTDIEIAMTVYANDGKPINVDYLVAYMNGKELSTVYSMHNYTQVIRNYNHDKIKFCFNTGTNNKVTAYAAGWNMGKHSFELMD